MWYEITNLVAFTYDIASISRKRYYYLLDKGEAKHIAVALVTDYFIRHLLEFVSSHGGFLPLWWVVFLYETALCQTIFSKASEITFDISLLGLSGPGRFRSYTLKAAILYLAFTIALNGFCVCLGIASLGP